MEAMAQCLWPNALCSKIQIKVSVFRQIKLSSSSCILSHFFTIENAWLSLGGDLEQRKFLHSTPKGLTNSKFAKQRNELRAKHWEYSEQNIPLQKLTVLFLLNDSTFIEMNQYV
jgi:hypothetical protein